MIYETIHDPEYRKTAESWRKERLRQMDAVIELHAKLLSSEREEREQLAAIPDGQLALEFAGQTEKDLALLVKRSHHPRNRNRLRHPKNRRKHKALD